MSECVIEMEVPAAKSAAAASGESVSREKWQQKSSAMYASVAGVPVQHLCI